MEEEKKKKSLPQGADDPLDVGNAVAPPDRSVVLLSTTTAIIGVPFFLLVLVWLVHLGYASWWVWAGISISEFLAITAGIAGFLLQRWRTKFHEWALANVMRIEDKLQKANQNETSKHRTDATKLRDILAEAGETDLTTRLQDKITNARPQPR